MCIYQQQPQYHQHDDHNNNRETSNYQYIQATQNLQKLLLNSTKCDHQLFTNLQEDSSKYSRLG